MGAFGRLLDLLSGRTEAAWKAAHGGVLRRVTDQGEEIGQLSEQQAQLDAKLAELKTGIVDAATRVQTKIDALTAQIGAGTPPTDLTAELENVSADIEALKALGADTTGGSTPA